MTCGVHIEFLGRAVPIIFFTIVDIFSGQFIQELVFTLESNERICILILKFLTSEL